MTSGTTDFTTQLADQLDFHWRHQLRPRLTGLTDDEYFWQPVDGCWTVHRDGAVDFAHPAQLGSGCGPAEGQWASHPMSELVLHINREMIHHGAEIACLQDLYVHTTHKYVHTTHKKESH